MEVARELRKVVMREQQLGRTGMHGVGVGGLGAHGHTGVNGMAGTPGSKAGVRRTGAGDIGGL
jgi:hypothetical protein